MLVNQIIYKKKLSENVFRFTIKSPFIAAEHRPGQFIMLQIDTEYGERIPLTIADSDKENGTITIVFQAVGKTTCLLSRFMEGDSIANILGPLGNPTHIENFGRVICVGGGIGTAPLFPIVKGLKKAGNEVITIIGSRTRDLVIMEKEMRQYSDDLIICTDDGSYGRKDLVTVPLKELCKEKPDMVIAIGPPVMMKFCAETTRVFNIPTVVSLNTIMVDGTGMCGGCRVSIGGKTKFVCVDGPEFDAHLVDFDNMILRLNSYKDFEKNALHKCRLEIKE